MNYIKWFSNINKVVFRKDNEEQGSSLIVVLVMMATMVAIAFGAIQVTQLNVASSGAHKKGKQAFYSSEVGLDLAVNDIIQKFEDLGVYTTTADNGGSPGITTNYRGHNVTYNITNPLAPFIYQTVAGNSTIFHFAHTYDIESTAVSTTDNSTQDVRERIRILETPLVQYYIFFGGTGNNADLEVLPGPIMASWGRIHANGDIYIGTNNGFYLTNYDTTGAFSPHLLSAGGEIFTERKNDGSDYGTSNIYVRTNDTQTTFLPHQNIPVGTDPVTDPKEAFMIPNDDITTATESRETDMFNDFVLINEQVLSAPGQTQFWRGDFYEQRATNPQNPNIDSMRIIKNAAGNLEIWVHRPADENVTLEVMAGTMPNGEAAITPPVRETVGSNQICDRREGDRELDFYDIDLSLLHTWYRSHLDSEGLLPGSSGMLVYTSRSDHWTLGGGPPYLNNDPDRLDAIRLVNMGGSTNLRYNTTVATDNPLYIHGHFNDGASGGTVRGVALVADAINILSQGFTSKLCTQSHTSIPNPPVTNINAAFFGGNVPTPSGGGTYSGGLENYPRFHEKWGGVNCNILGSFINLWTSSQATGNWGQSGVYQPPNRNWGWDVRFQNPNFWPPFIPSVFSVERVGYIDS